MTLNQTKYDDAVKLNMAVVEMTSVSKSHEEPPGVSGVSR